MKHRNHENPPQTIDSPDSTQSSTGILLFVCLRAVAMVVCPCASTRLAPSMVTYMGVHACPFTPHLHDQSGLILDLGDRSAILTLFLKYKKYLRDSISLSYYIKNHSLLDSGVGQLIKSGQIDSPHGPYRYMAL
jgi:hypothetical protein